MSGFTDRVDAGELILFDGGSGTYLQGKGLPVGEAPETWSLSHPDVVRGMAADYFAAGSDVVTTNTFGGNRLRLKHCGLDDRVAEVNRTSAELARSVAPEGGFVAGSIGPTGDFLAPLGLLTEEALLEIYGEQAEALAEGGVDLFCVWKRRLAVDEHARGAAMVLGTWEG